MMSRDDIWTYATSIFNGFSRRQTAAGIKWIDEMLGALYSYLDNLSILDNTIFMFISDHGDANKCLYERGIRIFQFIRYPTQFTAGTIYDAFVISNIDLIPT